MRYGFGDDKEGRKVMDDSGMLFDRKMAEVRRMVVPGVMAPLSPAELRQVALERMENMSPDQRIDMKVKIGTAMAELDALISEMSGILSGIGEEMRKLTQYSRVTGAYSQTARGPRAVRRHY
jgi:hypothetical protein